MRRPPAPADTDAKLWRDLMDRIEAVTGQFRPLETAMARSVALAVATVDRLTTATDPETTKLLLQAQTTARQAIKAFDSAMTERARAGGPASRLGGPGTRKKPARSGVPSAQARAHPAGKSWLDEILEEHEH